jgi:hypothetical protein
MLLAGALLLPSQLAASEFDAAVTDLENAAHVHHMHIPMMGLVSGCAWVYTRGAVRGLHVANFEHIGESLPQERFRELMESRFSNGWSRLVKEQNFESHELTLIYTRPAGKRMEITIASLEGDEVSLVDLKVDAEAMARWVNHPREHRHDLE